MREIVMPKSSMTMTEGDLTGWLVEDDAEVREGDAVATIVTDKVDMDVEAPADGRLGILLEPGATVAVGTVIAVILEGDETKPDTPAESAPEADAGAVPADTDPDLAPAGVDGAAVADDAQEATPAATGVRASPAARAMARRLGVDLTDVRGSGPRGRVRPQDIDAARPAATAAGTNGKTSGARDPAPAATPEPANPADDAEPTRSAASAAGGRRYRPTGVRAAMARQMGRALQVPQFCLFADVAFVGLERTRARLARQTGEKVGVTDVLLRAVAVALGEHPALNAHWEDGEIVEFDAVNLGIAADTPAGLIVPVLHGVEGLAIGAVSARVKALVATARAGTLRPEDVAAATFTVSNLGMLQIAAFQAVVNPPQVAILSVGAGRGDAGRTTTLGLSADHRAVDGAQGARFLRTLRDVVETADPEVLAGA